MCDKDKDLGLCDYGCGQPAKFIFKNGKKCCSDNHGKCPEVRKRNGTKVKRAYDEGRKVPLNNHNHKCGESYNNITHEICDYGCGNEAQYILSNGKKCCSKYIVSCPEMKRKNSESMKKSHNERKSESYKAIKYDNINHDICDYGCGEEAHYILHNGKKCCSSRWNDCNGNKDKNAWSRGKNSFNEHRIHSKTKDIEDYFSGKITNIKSSVLKNYLIVTGYKEDKCESCGIGREWKGKYGDVITLELHHKDGNHYNNELENLEILCPNCHTQTKGYRNSQRKYKQYYEFDNEKMIDIICSGVVKRYCDCIDVYNKLYSTQLLNNNAMWRRIRKLMMDNNLTF